MNFVIEPSARVYPRTTAVLRNPCRVGLQLAARLLPRTDGRSDFPARAKAPPYTCAVCSPFRLGLQLAARLLPRTDGRSDFPARAKARPYTCAVCNPFRVGLQLAARLDQRADCRALLSARLRAWASWCTLALFTLALTACGAKPDKAALNAAEKQLRAALDRSDTTAVKAAVEQLRTALGERVGQPEGGEPKRVSAAALPAATADTARAYLTQYRTRHAAKIDQIIATVAEPTQQEAGLRQLATLIIANSQLIAAGEPPRETYRSELVRAADALCRVQRTNGLFPFPDIRQKNEFFGRMLRDLLAKHPDALVDGWIVSDGGHGDLQYDNGLCGVALLDAYTLTADKKYLAAAERSAGWVKTQPIVTNWNYNSFSVWFLARLAHVTTQREWLDEAMRRCRLGMLPGQMTNGRWVDPHNAKLVYHAILCRALVELAIAGKKLGATDAAIEQAATAGLDNAAQEILSQGVSVVTVPTEVFSQALLRWRDEPRWRATLNALATVAFTPGATESEIGFYAAAYLEHAKSR